MADEAPAPGSVKPDPAEGAVTALTPELKNELQKMLVGIVKTHLPSMIKKAVGESTSIEAISKQVEAAIVKMADEAPEEATPAPGPDGKVLPATAAQAQEDPKVQELKKSLEALQKRLGQMDTALKEKDKAAAALTLAAKQAQVQGHVASSLLKLTNNNQALARLLAKELAQGVDVGEDGAFVWKSKHPDGMGGTVEETVAFDDGLQAWAAGDGKSLLPARSPQLPGAGFPFDVTQIRPSLGQQHGPAHNPITNQMARDLQIAGQPGLAASIAGSGQGSSGSGK